MVYASSDVSLIAFMRFSIFSTKKVATIGKTGPHKLQ